MLSDNSKSFVDILKRFVKGLLDSRYEYSNLPLFIFDIIILPITLIRILLIYLNGSRYSVRGFRFLDVIMHASKPHFNKDDELSQIHTLGNDYRVVIRDDSRLYPFDIIENAHLLKIENVVDNTSTVKNSTVNTSTVNTSTVNASTINATKDELKNIFIPKAHPKEEINNAPVTGYINNINNIDKSRIELGKKSIWQTTDEDVQSKDDKIWELNSNVDSVAQTTEEPEIDVINEVKHAVQNIDSRIDLDSDSESDDESENEINNENSDKVDTSLITSGTRETDINSKNENDDSDDSNDGDDEDDNDDSNDEADLYTESIVSRRKMESVSDSSSNADSDSETESIDVIADKKKHVDPIDALLRRAKERREQRVGQNNGAHEINKSNKLVKHTSAGKSTIPTTSASLTRTDSIIDNLESAFEK